ncbi:MAG: YceI family protein [Oceanobacter sp.]
MSKLRILQLIFALSLAVQANADWRVVTGSSVQFQTTRNTNIVETHKLGYLSGSVRNSGIVTIDIDLNYLDSGNRVGEKTLKSSLFEIADFPLARFEGALTDLSLFEKLKKGYPVQFDIRGNLSLHGSIEPLTLSITAQGSGETGIIMAVSTEPIILSAAMFGMEKAVEILRVAAGLESVSHTVPVSFLLFLKEADF